MYHYHCQNYSVARSTWSTLYTRKNVSIAIFLSKVQLLCNIFKITKQTLRITNSLAGQWRIVYLESFIEVFYLVMYLISFFGINVYGTPKSSSLLSRSDRSSTYYRNIVTTILTVATPWMRTAPKSDRVKYPAHNRMAAVGSFTSDSSIHSISNPNAIRYAIYKKATSFHFPVLNNYVT